jgi:hypothetical protein
MTALKISPKSIRRQGLEPIPKDIKEFLKALAPENKTLAAIRATARKTGKSKLSSREIDREIRIYRRERQI